MDPLMLGRKDNGEDFPVGTRGSIEQNSDFIVVDPLADSNGEGNVCEEEVNVSVGSAERAASQPKGVVIKWSNCVDGRLRLLSKDFKLPKGICFSVLICLWFCGDRRKNIPPFRMLTCNDLESKCDKAQLTMMKKLMHSAIRGVKEMVGRPELVNHRVWTHRKALDFYEGVKHLFLFPNLTKTKRNNYLTRRHDALSWKTLYNILAKRKWRLLGESLPTE